MSTLLEMRNVSVAFRQRKKDPKIVADHISFTIGKGETVCIVGESGCGKSVTSLSIMGLLPGNGYVKEGEILLEGKDLLKLRERELDLIRGNEISMIFQDALASLNPVFTIGYQLTEACKSHRSLTGEQAREMALGLLERVGIPDPKAAMKKYPYAMSGGQRQRVMIAMALSQDPKLLIADEATTALDVTIQAQILALIRGICRERGMSLLLITHDTGIVAQMADRVLVMYAGQIIEKAPVRTLFSSPAHPYTKALLAATPDMLDDRSKRLQAIRGNVPADYSRLTGCRFYDRCPYGEEKCTQTQPERVITPEHTVRCHLAGGSFTAGALMEQQDETGTDTCPDKGPEEILSGKK